MAPSSQHTAQVNLARRFPPSEPCSCEICLAFCIRPGWWTVAEAGRAFAAGYAMRMMLEISPGRSFGVLSPAFSGCEGKFASNTFAHRGCGFLQDGLCALHGSAFQPLECRFCHHDRPGQGVICHAEIETDWMSPAGRAVVSRWCRLTGIWSSLELYGLEKLKK